MREISARTRGLRPWLALVGLCALFELPSLAQPDRVTVSGLLVPGDALLLAALALGLARSPWPRRVRLRALLRAPLTAAAALLLAYRVDEAACLVLMRHRPALYDQLFLLRHLAVLLMDLWGGWAWLGGAAVLALLAGLAWLAHALLRAVAREPHTATARSRMRVLLALGAIALLFGALSAPVVRWSSAQLARDVLAARTLARRIARGVEHSPYRDYATLALPRKPNLHVYFVESYGRVAASDPHMAPTWRSAVLRMEHELAAAGYHFASAFADAPISGGRSWLAHATLFTGTRIGYQALFERLFPNGRASLPHLPGFLHAHGYHTVLMAPADRARPGVRNENPYGYERTIGFQQLNYPGPFFGWGRVPDQYSLAYAQDHVFTRRDRPLFFVFTMVSAHSPWNEVPDVLMDTRNARAAHAYAAMKQRGPLHDVAIPRGNGALIDQTRRYTRAPASTARVPDRESLRSAYIRSVVYDLDLLRAALPKLQGDDLILILGDHQPPLVTSASDDFAAPVHVLARDPALLREFIAHGFAPRLLLEAKAKSALPHEAMFSLLVRALTGAGGAGNRRPPYLPHGVGLDD